ncbi:MAG: Slp family lipoprotein [Candidatus Methylomirabilales bacterium]
MSLRKILSVFIFILVGVLAGCASVVPETLQSQVDPQIAFSEVQSDPDGYEGTMVVLGGTITAHHSDDNFTELEVTELPLNEKRHNPILMARSGGRFVVATDGLLDPARYRPGRPITVVGRVQGARVAPGQDIPDVLIKAEYLYVWPTLGRRRLSPSPLSHHSIFSADPYRFRSLRRDLGLFTPTFGF